jgi:hypothetical protein
MSERPWETEPENANWTDDRTRLPCAMRRGPVGAWCGYVGLPNDHPLSGKSYNDIVPVAKAVLERTVNVDSVGVINLFCASLHASDFEQGRLPLSLALDCHGGLTFSGSPPWLPDGYWWFGFDCSHSGDFIPGSAKLFGRDEPRDGEVYRGFDYVQNIVTALARQLGDATDWVSS